MTIARHTLGALIVVVAAAAAAPSGAPQARPPHERIVLVQSGDLYAATPSGKVLQRLTRTPTAESAPALSPNGRRIAFERRGAVWVLHADRRVVRVAAGARSPSWSPDGARVAVVLRSGIGLARANGGGVQPLAGTTGASAPSWAPDGTRIAFALDGDIHVLELASGVIQPLTADPAADSSPAWSPDGGRVAFSRRDDAGTRIVVQTLADSAQADLTGPPFAATAPAWSRDGSRIAFASSGAVWVTAGAGAAPRRLLPGGEPAWGLLAVPPVRPLLLPDLDQRAPRGLIVTRLRGRWTLGFVSAVDNVGRGPIWVRARRPSRATPVMRADQLLPIAGGGVEVIRRVGIVRYVHSSSHSHWHLMRYQRYELRRAADFRVVASDRKSGFCLADHYGRARRRVDAFRRPVFTGDCGRGRPDLLSVSQGTSIGYTDLYPAHFHGQNVDVTHLPSGRYWLVHRSNMRGLLRERVLTNNAAGTLISLRRPGGRAAAPQIAVLRSCEHAERC